MKKGIVSYREEWEMFLKDYPTYYKFKDGYTTERQKKVCYFCELYKKMMDKKRHSFRTLRILNNCIHLFNIVFNETYPKYPLSKELLRQEKEYFAKKTVKEVRNEKGI